MNKSQITNVLLAIERVESLDLSAAIKKAYSDGRELAKIQIGEFSATDFIQLTKRSMKQLKRELNKSTGVILPYYYALPNNAGTNSIEEDILSMARWIEEPEFLNVRDNLKHVIYYQFIHNIWNNQTVDLSEIGKEADSVLIRINEYQSEFEKQAKSTSSLMHELEKMREEIINFQVSKRNEFNLLSENSSNSTEILQQINDIHNRSAILESEIKNFLKNQEELTKEKNSQFEEIYLNLKAASTQGENIKANLIAALKTSEQQLNEIAASKQDISNRTIEAKRLLGLSADAALSSRFSRREQSITRSLKWWRFAIGSSVVLAIGWSVVVFLCFSTKTESPYLDLVVNLLKTSPGYVVMGYIMAQYNKERSLEEEYAYRASISETINAYADLLEGYDGEHSGNESRQKMLLEAIKQVYSKPLIHKSSSGKNYYRESSLELLESIKEIVKKQG